MHYTEDMEYQEKLIFVGFLLIMIHQRTIDACRGHGQGPRMPRPSHRPLVALTFRQHIPNISETTIGASGPAEGKITRTDKKFKDLVVNYNTEIVFKNEEHSNADRTMSKRCKDRLDTLAILVGNHWPGVKLRVTDSWDEDGKHGDRSLHFEGRAVDITTDDRDLTKYGMLARLAVEAGFDWVFYESKYHIHASVIADDSEATIDSGCFPGESTVMMEDGEELRMADLKVGDKILTIDRVTGELKTTDVILLMHKNTHSVANFLTITAEGNAESTYQERRITLTPNHLLYVHDGSNDTSRWRPRAIFAENVRVGDHVYFNSFGPNSKDFTSAKVISIEKVRRRGVYAPLTAEGSLIVDGIVASSYAVFDNEDISHALFFPLRMLWRWGMRWMDTTNSAEQLSGVHWYPKHIFNVASTFLPKGVLNP